MSRYRVIVSLNPFIEGLIGAVQPMCRGCPPDTKAVITDNSSSIRNLLGPLRRPCPCRSKFDSAAEAAVWVESLRSFLPDVIAITPRVEDRGRYALALTWANPPLAEAPGPLNLLCDGCPPDTTTVSTNNSHSFTLLSNVNPRVYQFRIPQGMDFASWWNTQRSNPFFDDMLILPFEIDD